MADIPGLFPGNAGQEKSQLGVKMNLDGVTASVLLSMWGLCNSGTWRLGDKGLTS